MAEVITIVTSRIPADRMADLEDMFRNDMSRGVPPMVEETFLLRAGEDRVALVSLWHRRADLDAMLVSAEEPPARRLIRTHGGEPEATFWEVVVRGSTAAGSGT